MMPRCGKPYPPNPASTCTKVPNHDGPHQVYCADRLYDWHSTPPPLFLRSLSLNGDARQGVP